jgi:PAS domain S-box-containing protein
VRIVSCRDITERKQAAQALQESEERYRQITKCVPDLIWTMDLSGRFTYVNSAVERIKGWTVEEFLKLSFRDVVTPQEAAKDQAVIEEELMKATLPHYDRNTIRTFESEQLRKDGSIFLADVSAAFLWSDDGKPVGIIGTTRDISERKRVEEEREKLQAQLYQSQKMESVGMLAGGIAHDFNNMLTAIIGYASILQTKLGTDSPFKPYVDQILGSSEKSASLTSQLLAFSRKQILSPKETDLNELLKGIDTLMKRLIGEDIEFKTSLTDKRLTAMIDAGQMEQVLLNLCTNARDAMPHGGLLAVSTNVLELDEKRIRTYDLDQPGRYAIISISDTGHGMEEMTRERIFEPFYTTKDIGKGTGLGLSIVYGIIKQHNGNITVYSEPGKGTTFKIFLPLIVSPVETANKESLVIPMGGKEAILVSEDDEVVRSLASHVLQEAGYTVIEAVDGDDAINKFMENKDRIKLAILDVVMPKKSGKEVSDAVRKMKSDMKILLTSGYTADIISSKGITEEGLDFISKPITPDNLLRKVREVLDS